MNKKCTTVNCSLTGCKYNSACCANPACKECYCTLHKIDLIIFNMFFGFKLVTKRKKCDIISAVKYDEALRQNIKGDTVS